MTTVTANALKTKGISVLDPVLAAEQEVMLSVRGQSRYVIMDMARYNHLRECELEAALAEARRDVAEGKVHRDSVGEHIRRISRK